MIPNQFRLIICLVERRWIMTRQELIAVWEYAEHLEKTEKGSKLYNDVKALLLEEIMGRAK